MRSNSYLSASVTYGIAVVIVYVRSNSRSVTVIAVHVTVIRICVINVLSCIRAMGIRAELGAFVFEGVLYGSYVSAAVARIVTVVIVVVSRGCSYVVAVLVVTGCIAIVRVNVLSGFADLTAAGTYRVFTVEISVSVILDFSYLTALVTGFITVIGVYVSSFSYITANVTVNVASVAVGMACGSSYSTANVTVGIASIIVGVINRNSCLVALIASVVALCRILVTCVSCNSADVTGVIANV